jgi:CheY-like chemotaxis protein
VPAYKGHVWVVDDDVFILQLCSNILTMHGVAHTCFSLPTKALQTPFPPNLGVVILDIRMADMDGFTLCKMLRQRQVVHQPLYIALTAQAMPYEQEDILKSGFDKLVMKPFQEHEFMNALTIAPLPIVQRTMPNPNLSSITGLAGGNQQTINTILRSFVAETRHDLVTVRLSLACQDNDTLAETLHKLASRVGQVQMTTVSQELRSMEVAIRNGNVPPNMEAIIRAQIPLIEHALKFINGMLPPDSVAT